MIQIKRGSTKSWQDTEVKLASGQPGYDKDTHQLKIGDGENSWADLPCIGGVDAVVDFGSVDGWNYQKWESGIAICWYSKQISIKSLTALESTGFFQKEKAMSAVNYPITFKTIPCETVSVQSSGSTMWLASRTKNTTSKTGEYSIISVTQASETDCVVSIQVEGLWK